MNPEKRGRNSVIIAAHIAGEPLSALAAEFGISKAACGKICARAALAAAERKARVSDILALASAASGVPESVLMSPRRTRETSRVRFAIYTVAREHGHSLPRIAHFTQRADHSSVMYGLRAVVDYMRRDPVYALFVADLRSAAATSVPFINSVFSTIERGPGKPRTKPVVFSAMAASAPAPVDAPSNYTLPRNDFTAGEGEQDAGHKFHDGIAAATAALTAALAGVRAAV